ncbi:hypothetical protein D9M68_610360 [compost metagenome]
MHEPPEAQGELGQVVFQVGVVVERLDQEIQRGLVFVAQPQTTGLLVQVVLQADRTAGQVGCAGGFVVVTAGAAVARGCVSAPFAVVGRHLDRAVAFPAFFHRGGAVEPALDLVAGAAVGGRVGRAADAVGLRAVVFGRRGHGVGHRRRGFGDLFAGAHRRIDLIQTKSLALGELFGALQKRVLVEHLLDLLRHLQRGKLQQTDRLLQLGRERQMLGDAQRQALFHASGRQDERAQAPRADRAAAREPARVGKHETHRRPMHHILKCSPR